MSNTSKRTFCNPLNLPYQYRWIAKGREGADPFIIIFKDKYYLFFSNAVGYFVSDDLAEWKHIKVDMAKYPIFDKYAPGACVIGDTLYLIFFGDGIISSSNPEDPDSWVDVGFPRGFSDPSLFYEDGYVYVCDGCDPEKPLYLWKLDPNKMHIHYTVYGNCDAVVGCLIGGVKYYLTVDSFNEGGITRGHEVLEIE